MYKVEVVQKNIFWIDDAKNADDAKRIATDEFIWDEDQQFPNDYHVRIDVTETA
tara:strand:- start:196 stop:357 length:162 start_codon:yes stop_codon:yes gene_type:complete